jgi:predicted transport protein
MTTINQREQIKKAFVSDVKNIGEYVYNNQDWYQEDTQRMRYILATLELSPGDPYSENKQLELGQEDNRFYNCIEFHDHGMYKINDEKKLNELMNMSDSEVADYIAVNEYDWIGDDYDHAMEYLFSIMNEWQDVIEYGTEDYDNIDCMTVTTRSRDWNVDPESGYKSENKYEVAYKILMEYWDVLPEEEKESINQRLNAVSC